MRNAIICRSVIRRLEWGIKLGKECKEVNCNVAVLAACCCLSGDVGSCKDVTTTECIGSGGLPQAGKTCKAVTSCLPPKGVGACCTATGCAMIDANSCKGTFTAGKYCSDVKCNVQ